MDATVADLVRIAGCRWKIEEGFLSAKNECGLDQYEVRRYVGWYRHIMLVMVAHIFLAAMAVQERERGDATDTPDLATSPRQKFAVCWQLSPVTALHDVSSGWLVGLEASPPSTRPALSLHAARSHVCGRAAKDVPHPTSPHYTLHTQAIDQR